MLRSNLAKDSVCVLTNIDGEFLMHIQIFIPMETSFFLKGNLFNDRFNEF